MKILVTGGAGFIGSNLVDFFMNQKRVKENEIIVYDNLYNGKREFIEQYFCCDNFLFVESDLLSLDALKQAMCGVDIVFHLAANSDIRKGTEDTELDLKLNTLATYNVLEAMRVNNVKTLIFTSSSVIYGEVNKPIDEDHGPLKPVSLYGASKLCCEAMISAFSNLYGIKAIVFRFANVVGKNSTHGVVYDFMNQLKEHPEKIIFLGNGKQAKPYIEVTDLIEGMIFTNSVLQSAPNKVYTFNIGPQDTITVSEIGDIVIKGTGNISRKILSKNRLGWPGDVPYYQFDTSRLSKLGWKPKYNSRQALEKAVKDLCKH